MAYDQLYHDYYYDMLDVPTGDSLLDIQRTITNICESTHRETATHRAAALVSIWLCEMAFSDNFNEIEEKSIKWLNNLKEGGLGV